MKQLVALIMIAFLVPAAAMAKDSSCKEDKAKFCKDAKASGKKVRDCLNEHTAELSAPCKEYLAKPKEAKPGKEGKKKEEAKPAEAAKPVETPKPAETPKPDEAAKPAEPASPGGAETK